VGVDPIIALRFTRLQILIYDSFLIIFLMAIAQMAGSKMRRVTKPLCIMGKWSYAIYLFHTLALRILFAFL
jgi:peptidoglycan/LPS O-acetylase OafA/YrhL